MLRNQAGQVVTANLINRTTGLPVDSGTVTVQVLGDGGTKANGTGTIENEGGGTWSYRPTQVETNYAAVTYSFYHDDAIRVDVQFHPEGDGTTGSPDVDLVAGGVMVPVVPIGPQLTGSNVVTTVTLGVSECTLTLSDAVSKLSDRAGSFEYDIGSGGDPREQRRLVTAVRGALRDIASVYDWRYYQSSYRLTTSDAVNITSVTYVASTGIMTITSSEEWPADAIYGDVTISGVRYAIATRTSNKVIVLHPTGKPASNVTSAVQWTRSRYVAPLIRSIYGLWEEGPERPLNYLSPAEFRLREMSLSNGGTAVAYTIEHGNRDSYIALTAAPVESRTYMLAAKLAPPYPKLFREFSTLTASPGSYAAICPLANETWIGSVIRIAPTGITGTDAKDQAILYGNWGWQSLITAVNGTAITLSEATPRSLVGERTVASSPIDVSATMQTYFESLAYERYCRNHKHDSLTSAVSVANADLMRAMEADAISNQSTRFSSGGDSMPLYDIHSETWL